MSKLLILADSPTIPSGFARVIKNLLPHFIEAFDDPVEHFAIGYRGCPYAEFLKNWLGWDGPASETPLKLYPAGSLENPIWWNNLSEFLNLIRNTKPTHVFLMHDPWVLNRMAGDVQEIQNETGIQFFYYIPVDGPMRPEWSQICSVAAQPVAYTDYGKEQILRAYRDLYGGQKPVKVLEKRIEVIPHGTDTDVYYPLPEPVVQQFRSQRFRRGNGDQILGDDSFLITCVNSNSKRKDIVSTIEVFRRLNEISDRDLFLYLHMNPVNPHEGYELEQIVKQMDLSDRVLLANPAMVGVPEVELNRLYNASDLFLSTSLGEGWGLTITEAMACGIPVAAPNHTSIPYLLQNGTNGLLLPTDRPVVLPEDNSVLRKAVNPEESALAIHDFIESEHFSRIGDIGRQFVSREAFNWTTIANRFLDLML